MTNNAFIITDHNKQTVCEILATYHDDETNKDFIIYTDKTLTSDNNVKIYYSLYENVHNGIKLIDIKTKKEKEIGLLLIKEILKDLK